MAEFNLSKVDYLQVGITQTKCMRIMPPAKTSSQAIAVGDRDGVVQVFGVKSCQAKPFFKTPPGTAISRLELGGSVGQPKERVFVAAGTNICGYSKKGKQFLQFDTSMTEPVKALYVDGADLFVGGKYIYQRYNNLIDKEHLLCADHINDLLCLPLHKVETPTPVLACQDRILRVLKDSSLLYEVEVPGPPSTLALHSDEGGETGENILYGTSDGVVGLVQITRTGPIHRWELRNEKGAGGITCLDNYDINGNGIEDLIISRDDGTIDVFTYDDTDEPVSIYNTSCNECVTSVQGGRVGNPNYGEIVCSTYAGWIFGMTTEQLTKGTSSSGDVVVDEAMVAKMADLRKEVEELQHQLGRERENYQAASQRSGTVSAVPLFQIQEKFVLNPEEAAYTLCIECQAPLDNVLVQSDVPVDLLDVHKNSAVVSYSQCKPEEGNFLLATYRCQSNTTRIEVKIRSIEGQYGTIQVYVTPRLQPKVCQVRQFPVKPLSLHRRTHTFDGNRPLNVLRLTGPFSLAEMHSWAVFCLPETPERVPPPSTDANGFVCLTYESTFLHTQLECQYKKGEAIFRSDNLSTISILKDVLTKEGTKKKIALNIKTDIEDTSIDHTLQLIHPKMEALILLAKKVQLIEPLRELTLNEAEGDKMLSPEYSQILAEADQLLEEFKKQPCHLERLYGMITDLFIDKFKFRGQNVKSRVPALLDTLDDYNLDKLKHFFKNE